MADLALWKKYPAEGEEGEDSYRLDHPHFQNVQRVTYAKGVITDFKRVDEDDEASDATSMVKVDIEGYGESDYIPLFYHPKAQYWDSFWEEALNFDEEQKCFTKAYWSFRCDDEVVVLMQASSLGEKLEPFAVIGFADNYPRIGEHIAKITGPEIKDGADYYKAATIANWEEGDKGPDGLDLQLLTKAEKREVYSGGKQYYSATYREQINGRYYTSCFFEWWGGGFYCKWNMINEYKYIYWYTDGSNSYQRNVNDYIFCIGPYVYVLRMITKWQELTLHNYFGEEGPYLEELYNIPGICSLMPEWEADNEALCDWEYPVAPSEENEVIEHPPVIGSVLIRALYTKENYDKAMNWEYIEPDGWSDNTNVLPPGFKSMSFYIAYDNKGENKNPQFELYVRPHTKEELIEAGLYDGSP